MANSAAISILTRVFCAGDHDSEEENQGADGDDSDEVIEQGN